MCNIIRESNLLEYPFSFYKAEKIQVGAYVQISGDLSNFINFCQSNDISVIFYKYDYYNKEEYEINNEILQRNTENDAERKFCAEWVKDYNQKMSVYDFSNPYNLYLCASTGTIVIVFHWQNLWIQEEKAENALLEFLEEHEDELIDLLEYEEGPSLMDEFSDILLSDKEFRYSTNQGSRSRYMEQFMRKKEHKRFWALAKGAKTEWDRKYRIDSIVDRIYTEYRNKCYKLKQQVGDPLPIEE